MTRTAPPSSSSSSSSSGATRRHALAWAGASAAALVGLAALPGCAGAAVPRYTFGVREIEQALASRFPRRYPLGGLIELELQAPRVALVPERDQLNAVLDVQAGGLLLNGQRPRGVLDVDFGLRYEPSDRTVRAQRVQVNGLRIAGLPPASAEALARYGTPLAAQALEGAVLHTLRPEDLALADGLGVQPGRIAITRAGIVVEFAPRASLR